jgi:CDP-diacylglycerol--serine O-phosphatidyltransferase
VWFGAGPVKRRIPDLGKLLFVLPNLFTMSSVLCGFYAMTTLANGGNDPRSFLNASLAIVFAGFFDGMDGRVARLTRTQSDFGVQLDSLADLISFGAAPALLVHQWALSEMGWYGLIAGFLFLAAGAARLARFNVMAARNENPSNVFVGLSIPLAAVALVSLVVACIKLGIDGPVYGPWIASYVIMLGLLQVSTVRFRSFKTLRLGTASVIGLIIALVTPIAIAMSLGQPWLMLLIFTGGYIAFGVIEFFVSVFRKTPTSDELETS